MQIINETIYIETKQSIGIYSITPLVTAIIQSSAIKSGQVLVLSRHTTTAIAINENEERLITDIITFLEKLAPTDANYLHNDLEKRPNIPEDEPRNAHSHLMAMMLHNSENIPIIDGKLALGTWQSILFCEFDGPRKRSVSVQIIGI
ncbi:MAG TPA: YjbQ family protein [Oscillatoriaceae cyanobacterium M33_DOE_052]|uniref:YjbQ family protein n=1 Tax=Planktothricoides sp. SpSt-374 TaxID=2282167 RepID=A0A7C3VIL5_9CYAN|nr:YjbQ family protein [Oscillatoriaceae cyanobacterium M33_DOE_052]